MDPVLWIFGYGSLVWRPAFPYAEREPGRVAGWARRFWQGSTDHRGVPDAPGRVATLVRDRDAVCWGMAYRVEAAACGSVLQRLDHRERGGFDRVELEVTLRSSGRSVRALAYVAGEDNPNYLGPAPLADIAAEIRRSRGPSGTNLEYVRQLAASLGELRAADEHLFELARLLPEEP